MEKFSLKFNKIDGPKYIQLYKHIKKLMPGHYLIVRRDSYKEYKYWDLPEIDEKTMLKDEKKIYQQYPI